MKFAPKESRAAIAKIGSRAILGVLPFGSFLSDLLEARVDEIKRATLEKQENNLREFHEHLLKSEIPIEESKAKDFLENHDFHALLKACAADIESEKIKNYATLTENLATGHVAKNLRRHFILSLSKISSDQINTIRKAYIAKKHKLKPKSFTSINTISEDSFLNSTANDGIHRINIIELSSYGFIEDASLSSIGEKFVEVIFEPNELTPESIEYKEWSGRIFSILCYELDKTDSYQKCEMIARKLHQIGHKSNTFAIVDHRKTNSQIYSRDVILTLGNDLEIIKNHQDHIKNFIKSRSAFAIDLTDKNTNPKEFLSLEVIGIEEFITSIPPDETNA